MKVKDLMTPDPRFVVPGTPLRDIAALMKELDVGMVPVCEGGALRGTVTDRDLVLRGLAGDEKIGRMRAADVMSPDVLWCFEDQDTAHAAAKMEAYQVRRLLVLDENRRLTGILSLGDLAVKNDERETVADALAGISL